MAKKLKWNFLLRDRCPDCGGFLSQPDLYGKVLCLDSGCKFKISFSRFKELVRDMVVRIR